MKHFGILWRHELHLLLVVPSTYVAAFLFLLVMALFWWIDVRGFTLAAEYESPTVLFYKTFWLPVCFVVPLLTMRSLAEERRQRTLESLLATPASPVAIVAAKFSACYAFYLLLWTATLAFPFLTALLFPASALEVRLLDPGPLVGGLAFIALSGFLFIAVGIFSSSLTRSQLVAGMLAFTLLLILLVLGLVLSRQPISDQPWLEWLREPVTYLQAFQHLEDFSQGVLDSRPVFYYLSAGFLLLGLAVLNVETRS